jgi:CRP-like cAMP-binding protein
MRAGECTLAFVIQFLERLDEEARSLLLAVARAVSYVKGAQLVRHGEPARGGYVLKSGTAEASVRLPGGETLAVASFGPGALFGEMALIERGTCTATVAATGNVDGWFVERDDFRSLVAQRVPAALRVQHALTLVLSDKLKALNARLLEVAAPEDRAFSGEERRNALAAAKRTRKPPFELLPFLPLLPAFEGFDAADVEEICAVSSYLELPRGQPLFVAGDESVACFVVLRGAVEIRGRHAGRERRIAVLGPGQLLGHMSLLEQRSHGSAAVVREGALLLEMPRTAFEALYYGASPASSKLHRAIQKSLLLSLGQTNRHLTRLISLARLRESLAEAHDLERAYFGQITAEPFNEATIAQLLSR